VLTIDGEEIAEVTGVSTVSLLPLLGLPLKLALEQAPPTQVA
jgi:hypothetical protein